MKIKRYYKFLLSDRELRNMWLLSWIEDFKIYTRICAHGIILLPGLVLVIIAYVMAAVGDWLVNMLFKIKNLLPIWLFIPNSLEDKRNTLIKKFNIRLKGLRDAEKNK